MINIITKSVVSKVIISVSAKNYQINLIIYKKC
jgi:hypothetical protein